MACLRNFGYYDLPEGLVRAQGGVEGGALSFMFFVIFLFTCLVGGLY